MRGESEGGDLKARRKGLDILLADSPSEPEAESSTALGIATNPELSSNPDSLFWPVRSTSAGIFCLNVLGLLDSIDGSSRASCTCHSP